jgi:hypothetical protein
MGCNPLGAEKASSGVEQIATGVLAGLCRLVENLQSGMSQQNRILPTTKYYVRVRPDATKVFDNAVKALPLAVTGITKEAGQLRHEAEDFAKKCMPYQMMERSPDQRDGAGVKGQYEAICPSLLEARTSARCTMARLQIHSANLLMAAEIVMSCVEVVADCGLDENPCLGPGWPSVYPGCGVLTDATGGQGYMARSDRDLVDTQDYPPPGIPSPARTDALSSLRLPRKAIEDGWRASVPALQRAVIQAAATSVSETVGRSREAVWLAYQRRNPTGNPSAKQQRGLDQPALNTAMDDIASYVGRMTGEAARARVEAVYGNPEVYGRDIAEHVEASATGVPWSTPQLERKVRECCEHIMLRHSRSVANDVSDEAVRVIRSLPREFEAAGDAKTSRDTVAQILDDETLEEISIGARAAVKAATYDTLLSQAEAVPGLVWGRVSETLAANG